MERMRECMDFPPDAAVTHEGPTRGRRSAHAEPASSGLVELLGLEAVGPGALVVLLREVARAVAVEERLADAGGVLLVARTPGRGRDVHDVAPALLLGDG